VRDLKKRSTRPPVDEERLVPQWSRLRGGSQDQAKMRKKCGFGIVMLLFMQRTQISPPETSAGDLFRYVECGLV
jgi:hypothetical protein